MEIVRNAIESSMRQDWTRAAELFDPNVEMPLHEYRRGKGSGLEVETDTAVVFTVRDGRVVGIQGYIDPVAASKPPDCRTRGASAEAKRVLAGHP